MYDVYTNDGSGESPEFDVIMPTKFSYLSIPPVNPHSIPVSVA